MGYHQRGAIVIKVQQCANGQWQVSESGLDQPLATFDDKNQAFEFANNVAKGKGHSRVELA